MVLYVNQTFKSVLGYDIKIIIAFKLTILNARRSPLRLVARLMLVTEVVTHQTCLKICWEAI